MLYSGDIEVPNEFGVATGQSFNYFSGNGTVGFGLPLFSQLSLGGKVKYYYSHLSLDSSDDGYGWSIDPAILARGGGLGLGVMVENAFTGGLVYGGDHREELERNLRAGLSYRFRLNEYTKMNLLGDIEAPFDSLVAPDYKLITPHLGVELWLSNIGLRAGYNGRALTAGTSLEFSSLRIDWAVSVYQSGITETHRISLVYRF